MRLLALAVLAVVVPRSSSIGLGRGQLRAASRRARISHGFEMESENRKELENRTARRRRETLSTGPRFPFVGSERAIWPETKEKSFRSGVNFLWSCSLN